MPQAQGPEVLIALFRSKTVVELPTIREALNGVSSMTAFRMLRLVSYRCSYNHNGRYYTLHDPTRYDRYGLWSWQGIHFSVDGSLLHTVRRLVRESEAGASHQEIRGRLDVRAQNTLARLVADRELDREKLDGLFFYFHTDPEIRERQRLQRRTMLEAHRFESEQVTDAVVIEVLLVLIRFPGARAGDVARRLRGHAPPITARHVRAVLERYGLDDVGKKGGRSKR